MSAAIGFCTAILSAIFNGSFASLFKFVKMQNLNIHPMVFMLYVSCGVFLSSWLVVPFFQFNQEVADDDAGTSMTFSGLGFVGGILFVIAIAASFKAVEQIGVALGQVFLNYSFSTCDISQFSLSLPILGHLGRYCNNRFLFVGFSCLWRRSE